MNEIFTSIEKLSPHSTEVITMFYDMDNITCKEVGDMMTFLHKELPDYKMIALPNKTSLESCSKDVLENIISMISEIIESL